MAAALCKVASRKLKPPPPNRTTQQYYRTTRTLERKLARDRKKHTNWIESAHYDAANFVLQNHEVIVQPWLHSAELTQKSKPVIRSKVVCGTGSNSGAMVQLGWVGKKELV